MRIMELLWPPSEDRSNRGLNWVYRRTPSVLSEGEPVSGNAGNSHEGHGLTGWLLRCWRRSTAHPARLALIERIALGPKHFLTLIEAEGMRLLVATSADGASAFFSLERPAEIDTPRPDRVHANCPETFAAEKLSTALPQAALRRLRRGSRQRQAVRRSGFDGRIS
jgi:hypothetical protein